MCATEDCVGIVSFERGREPRMTWDTGRPEDEYNFVSCLATQISLVVLNRQSILE